MYTYFVALNYEKEPDGKYFRLSSDANGIKVEACLGYQAGGWQPFSPQTFELFREAGLLEVTLEQINADRASNNLPPPV